MGVALCHKTFPCIACIAPYSLVRLLLDPAGKFGTRRHLEQRVTPREGDMGKGVTYDNTHQFVHRNLLSPILIPRLRIVASWAMMATSRQIDARTETRAIHRGIFQNIKYTQVHVCKIKQADRRHSNKMLGLSARILHIRYITCVSHGRSTLPVWLCSNGRWYQRGNLLCAGGGQCCGCRN